MRDRRLLLAVFAGGAAGALARAGVAALLPVRTGTWPWGTFAVNVLGSFLLGYFVTRLHERLPLSAYRHPLLGTGFCGALTTFSTFQLELFQMVDADLLALALAYTAASVGASFLAVAAATAFTRRTRLWR